MATLKAAREEHDIVDEGKVESGFGQWVKASSIVNPDQKEYSQKELRTHHQQPSVHREGHGLME